MLFQANDKYIRGAKIASDLGIQFWDQGDWIVSSMLYKLEEDGRVEARYDAGGRRRGRKLSDRERNQRTDG